MKYVLALCFCVASLCPAVAFADEVDVEVEGTFTTAVVPCPTLCTHSVYAGSLQGTSDFELISIEPTDRPDVLRYVGTLVVHTATGDLVGQDIGFWNTATGKYTDTYQITTGNGVYAGAIGVLKLKGTLDALTGVGSSIYRGSITWAD